MTKPNVKIIETCEFPIVEKVLENGYRVLELPSELRTYCESGEFQALRINSKEIATRIPDYTGKTPTDYSLLPHQDHHPEDKRRFLALSQTRNESRNSSTFILFPELFKKILPELETYFKQHRKEIQNMSLYDPSFIIQKQQFDRCFEQEGFETVVSEILGEKNDEESSNYVRAGLLGYLIQGELSNTLVAKLCHDYEEYIFLEHWSSPGIFIFDNSQVFHGRLGGNKNRLQRNWMV